MKTKTFKHDMKRFSEAIARWQGLCDKAAKEGDLEMARQYEQDVKDLTDIYNFIQEGKYELVFDLAWELDTLVADQIPRRLVKTIERLCKPQ
jgi:hypothetical protein